MGTFEEEHGCAVLDKVLDASSVSVNMTWSTEETRGEGCSFRYREYLWPICRLDKGRRLFLKRRSGPRVRVRACWKAVGGSKQRRECYAMTEEGKAEQVAKSGLSV
jgi:hypothetical protein